MNKIINFHEVNDAEWFEMVIIYLKNKYKIITAKELYAYYYNGYSMSNACLITVDDGHISSYNVIYPILKKHQVPAVFFVSPEISKRGNSANFWFQELYDYDKDKLTQIMKRCMRESDIQKTTEKSLIDRMPVDTIWDIIFEYQRQYSVKPKSTQNMSAEQVKEIDKEGLVEIGAHTLSHPFLANETDERSREEIQFSISMLEEILQHPVLLFAYPNGRPVHDWGEREIGYLKETSVKLAFSTFHRDFTYSDDVYAIPRYGLTKGSLFFIKLRLLLGEYYLLLKKTIKKDAFKGIS
jgi:peptidoglycan/xylan/chitin deacetylase (PgdA/CDA1 family)